MLLRVFESCAMRAVFPRDSSITNMATETTQLSVKNLLEKPNSIKCSNPFMTVKIACSWKPVIKKAMGQKVIRFRNSSLSVFRNKSYTTMQGGWCVTCVLDRGANSDRGDSTVNEEIPRTSGLGSTRLGRIIRASTGQFFEKINGARRNFPMKIFLLLLGYYTANALATILGQTGDWDVLVAGIVVAAIEGIGILMYRKPLPIGKLQYFIIMVNYWKAGLCLGLFVDAFKLGS